MADDQFTFSLILFILANKTRRRRNSDRSSMTVNNRPSMKSFSAYLRRKTRLAIFFVNLLHTVIIASSQVQRSLWSHDRSDRWWCYIVNGTFTPVMWMENFRLTRSTFNMLCDKLRPFIKRENTILRKCIPVEKRVGIALYTLSTTCEYRTVAHLFGVSIASVCLIIKEFCYCVKDNLSDYYIQFPKDDNLSKIMLTFERKWGFPNCAGAIDGCHIPIIRPTIDHVDYFNRKGSYSILLQAVVDSSYMFRDTSIGWPGRVHDARVLANSNLYAKGQDGTLFPGSERRLISGTIAPVVILGDPAYPLLQWLMKPYAETTGITAEQKRFNYMLSRNRMVVENAFGRLKGRWRLLQKRLDCNTADAPVVILACCVLHNICESEGNEFLDNWNFQESASNNPNISMNTEDLDAASEIRNAFCRFFSE